MLNFINSLFERNTFQIGISGSMLAILAPFFADLLIICQIAGAMLGITLAALSIYYTNLKIRKILKDDTKDKSKL